MKRIKLFEEFFNESKMLDERAGKVKLPKQILNHKDIPTWAEWVAQHSDGEWTWYESYPYILNFKDGGGAWKQEERDGYQVYTGVKTNPKDWKEGPYRVRYNGDIVLKESVNEAYSRNEMTLTKMINYLKEFKKLYPDANYMVPDDYLGSLSTEVDFDTAIKILKNQEKSHKKEKDSLEFYVWHVEVSNKPKGFNKQDFIKSGIKGLRDFSKKYSYRGFDNSPYITQVRIGMTSTGIERFNQDMSDGKYGSLD